MNFHESKSEQEEKLNQEEENDLVENQEPWQNVKTRESKPLKKERLSAIRLKIKSASAAQFNHPLSLQKEILRCKPSLDPSQIKLAKLIFNTIIIATDDQETHQLLNEIWPDDAFLLGVIKQPPREMTEISLIIKGIDESVILDKEVMSQLANQAKLAKRQLHL